MLRIVGKAARENGPTIDSATTTIENQRTTDPNRRSKQTDGFIATSFKSANGTRDGKAVMIA
jgi:hypothetical protein